MAFLGYLGCVGPVLLALLFVADSQLQRPEVRAEPTLNANIRVKSAMKGPEAVVVSGPTIDYGVRPAMEIADLSAKAMDPRTEALASAKPDEMPKVVDKETAAAPSPQPRKRYARRSPQMAHEHPRVDGWSGQPFHVVSGFRY